MPILSLYFLKDEKNNYDEHDYNSWKWDGPVNQKSNLNIRCLKNYSIHSFKWKPIGLLPANKILFDDVLEAIMLYPDGRGCYCGYWKASFLIYSLWVGTHWKKEFIRIIRMITAVSD